MWSVAFYILKKEKKKRKDKTLKAPSNKKQNTILIYKGTHMQCENINKHFIKIP